MTIDPVARVCGLAFWKGPVDPEPLTGGITNRNFLVRDQGRKYVVRLGEDIPLHNVMRFNERAAAMAAEAAGVSPALRHFEPGVIVIDHIEGRTFGEADVRAELPRVAELIRRTHRDLGKHLKGPALAFWTFHVLRNYGHTLRDGGHRMVSDLPRLEAIADRIEAFVGPTEVVFAHNDLLPGNFIDDGEKLWLIDWDYAGFNTPLFDLGGVASNNGFSPDETDQLVAIYYRRAPDDALRARVQAMLVASLLREALWSMVSELHSPLDFDYRAYTAENLSRFERALLRFDEMTQ
ncbi:choline kinase family protein [Hansschlegelia quercus]|uniref:Choline kinase n=1 Tax=Hansschlegelia quercus TaxID=2528245 RepID=A0A4Q9GBD4_9HYPH|nr:choline kinase family protein [Hansschlegelia quercus]TBN48311.1 choline kinase [Hansschlegelia quercus]